MRCYRLDAVELEQNDAFGHIGPLKDDFVAAADDEGARRAFSTMAGVSFMYCWYCSMSVTLARTKR